MTRAAVFPPLAITLVLLAGCARPSAPPRDPASAPPHFESAVRVGDILELQGAITPAMAHRFLSLLGKGITKAVLIRSGGGDDQSAMTIGWAIHRHGLPLIVQGACMSACAHFVFVAAARREIEPDSLVVFHNNHASIAAIADDNRASGTESYLAAIDRLAATEKDYYRKLGLPVALLLEPQIEIRTQCFVYVRSSRGGISDIDFKAPYVGWIPRRSLLESAGIPVTGFWPDSLAQLEHAFAVDFRPGAPIRLLYGGRNSLMSGTQLTSKYGEIHACR